jgi:hypothetical protein
MNIDERIEALTQSVELLASLHKDGEKRMDRLASVVERMAISVERLNKSHVELEEIVTHVANGAARLLQVAEAHEHRISNLEDQRQ